ncbi:MAG TPA: FkbM family methyltransferase [Acidimicrobiales bacterium]|jgi:FkbM family methyltransferase|nr:FkbM family methyltransferase [Acidimicrobiales bacterium]
MRPSYSSRLAARVRRALGLTELTERVAAIESRLAAWPTPEPSYPRGPVYFGDQMALVATRWGAKMLVDTRDAAIAPWLVLDGMWETHVTAWLQSTLKRGDVFVDVGANVGYFTLLGARLVGSEGRVVSVEAHARLFAILKRNVVINGVYGYVTAHHRAAWSEEKELEFHIRTNFAGNSSVGTIDESGLDRLGDTEELVRVQGVPMDDLLADLPRVDVMKIDVEGAEVHVFEGLRATIQANPDVIIMFEWARAQIESVGDTPAALAELVDSFGFKLKLLETGEPIDTEQLLALPYGNVVAAR